MLPLGAVRGLKPSAESFEMNCKRKEVWVVCRSLGANRCVPVWCIKGGVEKGKGRGMWKKDDAARQKQAGWAQMRGVIVRGVIALGTLRTYRRSNAAYRTHRLDLRGIGVSEGGGRK